MPRVEREAKVKDEGNSVPSGNWSTDSQNGRVAPADPRNDISDLCPKERSPRNSKDTAQDTQAPGFLVDDPSLRD